MTRRWQHQDIHKLNHSEQEELKETFSGYALSFGGDFVGSVDSRWFGASFGEYLYRIGV